MKGLIYKQFYECFRLRKNIISWSISMSILILVMFLMPTIYSLLLTIVIALPFTGISTVQTECEQDDIVDFNRILLTMPFTRRQIIQSKFIGSFIYTMVQSIVITLPFTLIFVLVHQVVPLSTGLTIYVISILITFVMNGVYIPGFIALGNKKGSIIYVCIILLIAIGYVFAYFSIDLMDILLVNPMVLIIALLVLAIVVNGIGYHVALWCYNRKYYH